MSLTSRKFLDIRSKSLKPLIIAVVTTPLLACGGGQRALVERADEAARERDALRVAYEAQQLKMKELSERLLALEDRLTLEGGGRPSHMDASRGRSAELPSGGGLWGRPQARDLSVLPVVRLSRAQRPPSAQRLRDERLALEGRAGEGEVPTLTASNVARFRRDPSTAPVSVERAPTNDQRDQRDQLDQTTRKRKRRPYAPPQGAEEAASLGVVPLPKRPLTPSTPSILSAPPSPPSLQEEPRSQAQEQGLTSEQSTQPSTPQEPSLAALQQAKRHTEARLWAEAREAYELVITLPPSAERRAEGRFGLALSLKALTQKSAALSTFRALIQASPTSPLVPDALLEIGALQLSSGDPAQGRATLTRLKSLYPHTSAARRADGLLP